MKYTEENIMKQQALVKKQGVDKNSKSGCSTQTKPKISSDVKVEKEDVKSSETPRSSNSSLKRANTNVVSSGSSLRPELEMGLLEAFHDLVSHNMLDLRDVAYAESYLSTSTWASSIFLQQEDLEKRSAMIINARKNAEEKKKRRKMGACRKY